MRGAKSEGGQSFTAGGNVVGLAAALASVTIARRF